jgi:hypothetical protein
MQQIEHGIYFENSYPGVTVGAILLPMGTIMIDAPLRAEDARMWLNLLYSTVHGMYNHRTPENCPSF